MISIKSSIHHDIQLEFLFLVMRTLEIYSLSNVQIHNAVLLL